MGKSTAFDNAVLLLFFNGQTIANLAENATVSPLGSLYVALHSADPGIGGNQTTNEISSSAYNNYGRQAVLRTSGGWTVVSNQVSPLADIVFSPVAGDGTTVTATYFSVGTQLNGAGMILYSGALSPSIACTVGQTPRLLAASNITET